MKCVTRILASIVIFTLIFSIVAFSSIRAPAANAASNSDQVYENSKYGVKVHYPSDWQKVESEDNYFVRFVSPYEDKFDNFKEEVGIFTQVVESTPLNAYVNSYMAKVQGVYTDFKLQNSTDSMLAGNQAKTVYTSQLDFDKDGKFDHETMRIFTIKDNRAYVFIYTAVTGRYNTYLPEVQNMLTSLEIDTSELPKIVPSDNQPFENVTMGIKASFPSTWELVPSSYQKNANFFYSPIETDVDPFNEYVYADVQAVLEQETLQQYVDAFVGYFKDDPNYNLVESGQTTIAGIPGQKVVLISSGYVDGEDNELMGAFAVKGNYVYSVVLNAEKSKYSDYEPIALAMLGSIKITSSPSIGDSNPPASSLLTYSNSIYGISMQYPEKWEKSDNEVDPTVIVTFTGPSAGYFESGAIVSVSFEGVPPNFGLQDYVDASLQGLKNLDAATVTDIQTSQTSLGGKQAGRIQYTMTFNKTAGEVKILQIVTLSNNKAYIITYGSSTDLFESNLPTVEQMIKSFAFIPSSFGSTEPKEYLNYVNSTNGIKVDYPDNWRKSEGGLANGVIFYSPNLDASITVSYLDLTSPGTSLSDLRDGFDKAVAKKIDLYTTIESNSTTVGGIPAMKLVYSGIGDLFQKNQLLPIKVMQIWAIKDTRAFVVKYSTFIDLYPKYLSTVQKIVDSIQIDQKSLPKFITSQYESLENDFQIKVPEHWKGIESKYGNITRVYFTFDKASETTTNGSKPTASKDYATIMIAIGTQKDFHKENSDRSNTDEMKCDHVSSMDAIDLNGEAKALVIVEDCHGPKIAKLKSYVIQKGDKTIYVGLAAASAGEFEKNLPALENAAAELHLIGAVDITAVKTYADTSGLKATTHLAKNGNKTFDIDIATDSDVGIFRLDNQTKTLSFEVGGKEGTSGETYFEIGTLLAGPYTIMLDSKPMNDRGILVISDKVSGKTFLSLTYGHSTHTISIVGTSVVPEYSMPLYFVILALSIALVTAVSMGSRISLGRLWRA